MPTRIVIRCVDNDSFNGRYAKNQYTFKHFDLRHSKVYRDEQQHLMISIEPNVHTNRYVRAYANLFAGTDKMMKDERTDIRIENSKAGYTFFAFHLTADLAEEGHFNLMKHGNVCLDLTFGTALPNAIDVTAYAEFESVLKIDKSRNIIIDYKIWKDERVNNWTLSFGTMPWTILGIVFERYSTNKYIEKTGNYSMQHRPFQLRWRTLDMHVRRHKQNAESSLIDSDAGHANRFTPSWIDIAQIGHIMIDNYEKF